MSGGRSLYGSNSSIAVKARERREEAARKREAKQAKAILRKVEIIEKLHAALPEKKAFAIEARILDDVLKLIRRRFQASEIAELEQLDGALDRPIPFKPNGHLWVETEELKQWRAGRELHRL